MEFILDATVGLIDIQQNKVIYILSIVSVVLTPPVVVASIYGMNFQHMPELAWPYGYGWALGLMLLSAVCPYLASSSAAGSDAQNSASSSSRSSGSARAAATHSAMGAQAMIVAQKSAQAASSSTP